LLTQPDTLFLTINTAHVTFNNEGIPTASQFDDVYFSDANGLLESQYVFLHNNDLPQRWLQCQSDTFVIAETGFGTGLNFLATFAALSRLLSSHDPAELPTLYFISTEKYPLSKADLSAALTHWPQVKEFSDALIQQYPLALEGCHRLVFAGGKLFLDLWLGDIEFSLPQLASPETGLVDAWYLDGFAPSKNPQMWTPALYAQMVRLAKKDCTFATFTCAGEVKRGLQQAGFTVEKRTGFGRKRHMLAGKLENKIPVTSQFPYFHRNSAVGAGKDARVAIIGAGLAGAHCALAMVQKGYGVTLYCQDKAVALGASGNAQGGFYPHLNNDMNAGSEIHALAFTFARRHYNALLAGGYQFAHQWCGVFLSAFSEKVAQRYQNMAHKQLWPKELIHWLEAESASEVAGLPLPYAGMFVPQGGWINPPQLVEALLAAASDLGDCRIECNHQLRQVHRQENYWQLQWQQGELSQADIVIFATGNESLQFSQLEELPLRMVRGQVESLPLQSPLDKLQTVICHKGYLTPAFAGHHALGSTYIKGDQSLEYRVSEETLNLASNAKAMYKCEWAQKLEVIQKGRVGIRCGTPDHLPVVGAVADFPSQRRLYANLYKAIPKATYTMATDLQNLFVMTGLGSRGLTTAPLLAEVLACQISGQPLPLGMPLLDKLNPNRFLIRDLIRRIQ
jgi:tRNA 5-methylaminomethyl-2-thiouridine biosynthesis bifunctional protein